MRKVVWTASTDPDGDAVSYQWQLATAVDFATVIVQVTVSETRFVTTLATLAANLQGVELGGLFV